MASIRNVIIVSAAVIITGFILGASWVKTHRDSHGITVTGSAQKNITSDLIRWNASYARYSAQSPKEAYAALMDDQRVVRQYLRAKGIRDQDVVFNAVTTEVVYKREGPNAMMTNEVEGYNLTQSISIESNDVENVTKVSREATELLNSGIHFQSEEPSYYYTKLPELKVEMLSAATRDAKQRAERIASNAGGSLGALRTARMGAMQITAKNSADFAPGGALDTRSKEKTITAIAYLTFEVD